LTQPHGAPWQLGGVLMDGKITLKEFEDKMMTDISRYKEKNYDPCIEVCFYVDECKKYDLCWLGKMLDKNTNDPIFWYGLVEDGSEAYDYDSFEKFSNAKVFHGNNIKDIWNMIVIESFIFYHPRMNEQNDAIK